jgi:hypothetical protein
MQIRLNKFFIHVGYYRKIKYKKMKKIAFLLFAASLLLVSCASDGSSKKHNSDFLEPLEIEIADEIKGDAELVDLVKSSEKALNEFSDNIEQLLVDGKDIFREDFDMEEASLMQKLKAGKLLLEFTSNSAQIAVTMEKFDSYVQEKEKQGIINDTQLKALEQVGIAFKARMAEIDKKYKHYFDK